MRIVKVKTENFKGNSREMELSGKIVLVGPNGSGKTGLQKAVEIAITGSDSALGKKPKYVMQHISGNEGSVSITVMDGEEVTEIKRTFKRDKKGNVKMVVSVLPKMDERTSGDYEARIKGLVGSFPLMFDLAAFLGMSDSDYRDFFFRKCKVEGWGKEKIFDLITKGTSGLMDETKLQADKLTTELGKGWNDLLSVKDNLEYVIEKLKEIKNNSQSEIRGNVGASEVVEKSKVEDVSSKSLPELKDEILKYEKEKLETSGEIKVAENINKAYEEQEERIKDINEKIRQINLHRKSGNTIGVYDKQIADYKKTIDVTRELLTGLRIKRKAMEGRCPIGVDCKALTDTKVEIPIIDKQIKENEELLHKTTMAQSNVEVEKSYVVELQRQEERLKEYQEQMMKLPKPIDIKELATQEESLDNIIKKLRDELEYKIGIKKAEELQASIKLERLNTESRLEAIKVMQGIVGKDGVLGEIISAILRPFSSTINELLAEVDSTKKLVFKLEDEITGKAMFQFGWQKEKNFIPFGALSNGEKALFGAAIMVALILQNNPALKVLMIDNIEAVDDGRRASFISACCKFVDNGNVDNLIMAGCMRLETSPIHDIIDVHTLN